MVTRVTVLRTLSNLPTRRKLLAARSKIDQSSVSCFRRIVQAHPACLPSSRFMLTLTGPLTTSNERCRHLNLRAMHASTVQRNTNESAAINVPRCWWLPH